MKKEIVYNYEATIDIQTEESYPERHQLSPLFPYPTDMASPALVGCLSVFIIPLVATSSTDVM